MQLRLARYYGYILLIIVRGVKMKNELLFKVVTDFGNKSKQKEYRIYTHGHIEGFGKNAYIVNRYPLLRKMFSCHSCASSSPNRVATESE